MPSLIYKMQKIAAEVFFPRRLCLVCNKLSPHDLLCPDCREKLADLRWCPYCGTIIAKTETPLYRCRNCRGKELPYIQARSLFPYEGELRQRLLDMKYHHATGWRRPLGELLAEGLHRHYPDMVWDAVIPIPLSKERLAHRGYNQVELFTEIFCRETDLPYNPRLLTRIKDTPPLWSLTPKQREQVLAGAFHCPSLPPNMRILLIDDIFTSGSTIYSAAKTLMKAGAYQVYVLTIAGGRE